MTSTPNTPSDLYHPTDCIAFANELLMAAGMEVAFAKSIAETLVEADLMGHTTHGLQLLAPYLNEIEKGEMTISGAPTVLRDAGANIAWDGNYLPGICLMYQPD
ncbi:MAG: Ldh family oxidoreductase, partial [Bacteroidota bacterium]